MMPFILILFQLSYCSKDKEHLWYNTYVVVISPLNALRQLGNAPPAGETIVFKDQIWASLHVWNHLICYSVTLNTYVIYFVT